MTTFAFDELSALPDPDLNDMARLRRPWVVKPNISAKRAPIKAPTAGELTRDIQRQIMRSVVSPKPPSAFSMAQDLQTAAVRDVASGWHDDLRSLAEPKRDFGPKPLLLAGRSPALPEAGDLGDLAASRTRQEDRNRLVDFCRGAAFSAGLGVGLHVGGLWILWDGLIGATAVAAVNLLERLRWPWTDKS